MILSFQFVEIENIHPASLGYVRFLFLILQQSLFKLNWRTNDIKQPLLKNYFSKIIIYWNIDDFIISISFLNSYYWLIDYYPGIILLENVFNWYSNPSYSIPWWVFGATPWILSYLCVFSSFYLALNFKLPGGEES